MGRLHGPVVGGVTQIDQRVKFMKEVQSGLFYPWTNVWYVDQDDGNDDFSGRGPSDSKATIAKAEEAMATRDRIYLKPGSTDHELSAALTFDLNDIQVIGVSANRFQPHVEISMADETTFDPMITISGRGGYFANMTIKHGSQYTSGVGYATDLTCCTVSGRYNMFDNVYFYTPLYAEQDVATTYHGVYVTGHNNYFYQCKFGSDGLNRDQANYNVEVQGVGNIFDQCFFQMGADGTSPYFVNINSVPRDMKYTLFRDCTFYCHSANYGTTIGDAIHTTCDGGNTAGVILERCNFVNVGNVSDTVHDAWIWKENIKGEYNADTVKIAGIALNSQGA